MDSLRWILLGLGILVIAGVYLWTRWQSARDERLYGAMLAEDPGTEPAPPAVPSRHGFGAPADESFAAVRDELSELERAISEQTSPDSRPDIEGPEMAAGADPAESYLSAQELDLPGQDEKLLVFYLVAERGTLYQGQALHTAFTRAGLVFGEMDIYHRLARNGAPVFSVANVVEPGTFDQGTLDTSETRGVSLFMRLPGPVPSVRAFDDFSATAWQLLDELGGELRDESRNVATQETMNRVRETLVEIERKQRLVS